MKLKSTINQSWEEQNFTNSLSDVVMKVKKISRNYGISFDSSVHMVESQGSAGDRSKDHYSFYKSYSQDPNNLSGTKIGNSRTMGIHNVSVDIKDGSQYISNSQSRQYGAVTNNFEYQIQSTESIKNPTTTHVDYTYSDSNMGSFKKMGGEQWQNIEPSYLTNKYETNQEIEYNFSAERPKYENYSLEVWYNPKLFI